MHSLITILILYMLSPNAWQGLFPGIEIFTHHNHRLFSPKLALISEGIRVELMWIIEEMLFIDTVYVRFNVS